MVVQAGVDHLLDGNVAARGAPQLGGEVHNVALENETKRSGAASGLGVPDVLGWEDRDDDLAAARHKAKLQYRLQVVRRGVVGQRVAVAQRHKAQPLVDALVDQPVGVEVSLRGPDEDHLPELVEGIILAELPARLRGLGHVDPGLRNDGSVEQWQMLQDAAGHLEAAHAVVWLAADQEDELGNAEFVGRNDPRSPACRPIAELLWF